MYLTRRRGYTILTARLAELQRQGLPTIYLIYFAPLKYNAGAVRDSLIVGYLLYFKDGQLITEYPGWHKMKVLYSGSPNDVDVKGPTQTMAARKMYAALGLGDATILVAGINPPTESKEIKRLLKCKDRPKVQQNRDMLLSDLERHGFYQVVK